MSEVEETFLKNNANLMISVLESENPELTSIPLFPVPSYLVAEKKHPLDTQGKASLKDLRKYPILTVRGSSPKLRMSTALLESDSRIQFNDFHSKKIALLHGLGFGWLPEYLIRDELRTGKLKLIQWDRTNRHVFHPHLSHRGNAVLGKSAKHIIRVLSALKQCP